LNLKLINIHNNGKTIYLFCRNEKGIPSIRTVSTFSPFYYEPTNESSDAISYDGVPLKKIIAISPADVAKQRSSTSYSADIKFVKNYLIHVVDDIEKTVIKYFFIDIEVLAKELPDLDRAEDHISCISVYNSLSKDIQSWYLGTQEGDTLEEKEKILLDGFVDYVKKEQPDLILAWNINFDYKYLFNRWKVIFNSSFAKNISPVNQLRYGEQRDKDIFYPAGISILEYGGNKVNPGFFRKIKNKEQSYKLDAIALKYWKKGKTDAKIDFTELNSDIEKRNREDVEIMVNLEKEFDLIPYYDEIRRFSKCLWEDLYHNSRVIDSFILNEAKKRKIILPNKQKKEKSEESESFKGAYRRAETGTFKNIYKADVRGMYPSQLVNFCLDSTNIRPQPEKDTIKINDVNFRQNQDALLPSVAKDLLKSKDLLKIELKKTKEDSDEKKILQNKYDSYKSLVNSLFGVTAYSSFRLYDKTIASTITFLSRDLLKYCEEALQKNGCNVIYTDTDALMYEANEDKIDFLNELVFKWSKEKYNKEGIDIEFESEGIFDKLLILGKCHYYGYVRGKEKPEIKGLEIKRSNSTVFESKFQENLINKVLDGAKKEDILEWVKSEKERIKTISLLDIAFPCRITKKYVNIPIFKRAYENTRIIKPKFKVGKGELFYYMYVNPMGIDSNNKSINVLAFTSENNNFIKKDMIDWKEVTRRNIILKAETIFSAIGLDKDLLSDGGYQLKLF